jgi:hypothetical protein
MTQRTAANPWLAIPLDDYERHMSLPTVGQSNVLRDVRPRRSPRAGRARWRCSAAQAATGSTAFRRTSSASSASTSMRTTSPRRGAATIADVEREPLPFAAVELVYAALLFEYVAPPAVPPAIAARLTRGGTLVAVLQLPSAVHAVTPSPYTSLSALAEVLTLVAPAELDRAAIAAGFTPLAATTVEASGGKRFAALTFAYS